MFEGRKITIAVPSTLYLEELTGIYFPEHDKKMLASMVNDVSDRYQNLIRVCADYGGVEDYRTEDIHLDEDETIPLNRPNYPAAAMRIYSSILKYHRDKFVIEEAHEIWTNIQNMDTGKGFLLIPSSPDYKLRHRWEYSAPYSDKLFIHDIAKDTGKIKETDYGWYGKAFANIGIDIKKFLLDYGKRFSETGVVSYTG